VTAQHHRNLDQWSVGAERVIGSERLAKISQKGKALTKEAILKAMSPSPPETSLVTEEEAEEADETSEEHIKDDWGKTQGQVAWQERLRLSI
jgi:hypothetical protein